MVELKKIPYDYLDDLSEPGVLVGAERFTSSKLELLSQID